MAHHPKFYKISPSQPISNEIFIQFSLLALCASYTADDMMTIHSPHKNHYSRKICIVACIAIIFVRV